MARWVDRRMGMTTTTTCWTRRRMTRRSGGLGGRGKATVASSHPRDRKGREPLPSTPPGQPMTSPTGLAVVLEYGLGKWGNGVLSLLVVLGWMSLVFAVLLLLSPSLLLLLLTGILLLSLLMLLVLLLTMVTLMT